MPPPNLFKVRVSTHLSLPAAASACIWVLITSNGCEEERTHSDDLNLQNLVIRVHTRRWNSLVASELYTHPTCVQQQWKSTQRQLPRNYVFPRYWLCSWLAAGSITCAVTSWPVALSKHTKVLFATPVQDLCAVWSQVLTVRCFWDRYVWLVRLRKSKQAWGSDLQILSLYMLVIQWATGITSLASRHLNTQWFPLES